MCGLAGKIYFQEAGAIAPEDISRMLDKIKHRGPDDSGVYVNPQRNIGLGQQRLSIIDLSPAGHQPMTNEDGSCWIVFNGEIYNFQALRDSLVKSGHKFHSQTDTEVILHLYEEKGEKFLNELRGMFALAVWDEKNRILLLARDRAGKKPLKYYCNNNFLVFASELKAFWGEKGVLSEPDWQAINHYLTLQYVPSPLTGFSGIKKLPAGHYLKVDLSQKTPLLELKRYWQFNFDNQLNLSEEEWAAIILEKIEECVKARLISDVPLGAFLSGGLDSSFVVALMAKNSQKPVKTFSIGFEEKDYNELPFARLIAQRFNTEHHEFIVKPQALEVLPKMIWHYEEPYADSSALPVWYLARLTKEHITVALNGDGGDENFAGYGMFPVYQFAQKTYKKVPCFLRSGVVIPGAQLFNRLKRNTFSERVERFTYSFEKPGDLAYLYYVAYFTPEQKNQLFNNRLKVELASSLSTEELFQQICNESASPNPLNRVLYFNFASYLPDDLLVKVDIATMAFGLEGRSPFLDQEFLELTAKIPFNLKVKNRQTKYIFKKAAEGLLPKEIIYRKKKGFGVPIEHWFRGELKGFAQDTLLGSGTFLHQYLNRDYIEHIFQEHLTTKINRAPQLWALLTLELWLKQFFMNYGK